MRLSIVLILTLAGCARNQSHGPTTSTDTKEPVEVTKAPIRNESCYPSANLKVFQVFKDGILGHLCPVEYPSYYSNAFDACVVEGDLVYLPVPPKKNDFVDDQKIILPSEFCFAPNGTFRYETKNKAIKTVRKIIVIDSKVSNSIPK